ncbi:MAG: hypothetical protein E7280_12105 [Lachnospiraceae bacterium]|nr:hypothetical protein [Lachnospiraceae bacterium]
MGRNSRKQQEERRNFTAQDFMRRSALPKDAATIQARENLKRSGVVDKNGYVKEPYVDVAKEFREK